MNQVTVLIGAGAIGLAIARRVSSGTHLLIGDLNLDNAEKVKTSLIGAGFEVSAQSVNVTSAEDVKKLADYATSLGEVTRVIHSAGVSPSQSPADLILKVDFLGTSIVLEAFGKVISKGGAGLVVSSQASHRMAGLSVEENRNLALTPTDKLLDLPILQPDHVKDSLYAYQLAKRGCALRVMAEAVKWGQRGARVNTISPGITMSPLASTELSGSSGAGYQRMIESGPVGRAGTPDEIANVAELLLGSQGAYISGSDFLVDGGVSSAHWFGDLQTP